MKSVISGCRGTWREVQLALIGVASESSVCWCENGPSKWLAGVTCLLWFPAELLCCIAAHHQRNECLAGDQLECLSDPCVADAELSWELGSVLGSTACNKDILEFSPVNLRVLIPANFIAPWCSVGWAQNKDWHTKELCNLFNVYRGFLPPPPLHLEKSTYLRPGLCHPFWSCEKISLK